MSVSLNDELCSHFAGVISDLALNFALRPDDEVVDAVRQLRAGIVSEYQKISDSEDEAKKLANDLLAAVLVQRHELERFGSIVSRAVH
jgi:hypothetical protein